MKVQKIIWLSLLFIFLGFLFYPLFQSELQWQRKLKYKTTIDLDIVGREDYTSYYGESARKVLTAFLKETKEVSYTYRFFPMYYLSLPNSNLVIGIREEKGKTILEIDKHYYEMEKDVYDTVKEVCKDNPTIEELARRIQVYGENENAEKALSIALEQVTNQSQTVKINKITKQEEMDQHLAVISYAVENTPYLAVVLMDQTRIYYLSSKEYTKEDEVPLSEYAKLIYNNTVLGTHDH